VRRVVVGTIALALAAATLGTGAARASVPETRGLAQVTRVAAVSPPSWGTCKDAYLAESGAVCATLKVPLDWKKPAGPKVSLALSMVKHTSSDAKYQGVMLTNPGGPGGSGLWMSTLGGYVPNHAGDTYDWIGFDPRGVGDSRPALRCIPDFFHAKRLDYYPGTAAREAYWIHRTKAYAAACGKNGGTLLEHLKTVDSVHDMEAIRTALGASTINYYGYSYGTYLGQVYATLFPRHVRRMVLDSNVDPRRVWYGANLDQDVAFEVTMAKWFAWVARNNSSYHLGTTAAAVKKLFYGVQAALAKKPAGGVVGPDEWNDVFLGAGYYTSTWTDLADVFNRWAKHHLAGRLIQEYNDTDTPGDDNEYAIYDAVQCTDVKWPTAWTRWRSDNDRVYKQAPFETWSNAWYNAPCRTWPAAAGVPVVVNGYQAPPILLIDETLDAATPYTGSLWVRHLFPRSRLLSVVGGTSHANSLDGNACEDNAVAAYLAKGTLPARKVGSGKSDKDCKPLPLPTASTLGLDATTQHASPFVRLAQIPARLL
jgi:pimeloyl-ACP methyl ester carboxylesterase